MLSGLERVPICVAYDVDGAADEMPMTQTAFHHATPVYEYLAGWSEDIRRAAPSTTCRPNARPTCAGSRSSPAPGSA